MSPLSVAHSVSLSLSLSAASAAAAAFLSFSASLSTSLYCFCSWAGCGGQSTIGQLLDGGDPVLQLVEGLHLRLLLPPLHPGKSRAEHRQVVNRRRCRRLQSHRRGPDFQQSRVSRLLRRAGETQSRLCARRGGGGGGVEEGHCQYRLLTYLVPELVPSYA